MDAPGVVVGDRSRLLHGCDIVRSNRAGNGDGSGQGGSGGGIFSGPAPVVTTGRRTKAKSLMFDPPSAK